MGANSRLLVCRDPNGHGGEGKPDYGSTIPSQISTFWAPLTEGQTHGCGTGLHILLGRRSQERVGWTKRKASCDLAAKAGIDIGGVPEAAKKTSIE
jgi:hypothetical protein